MFVDEIEVKLRAGNGGDGCLSFRREKYIPKGGPNGGDGGRGGDILLLCDRNVSDFTDLRYCPHATAESGQAGMGSQCHGRNGKSVTIRVPEGTAVYGADRGNLVAELLKHGDRVILLRGGSGGKGNVHFKSSTNQAPRRTIPGEEGESGLFRFELKTIADLGLVGLPNAGKSSLMNCLTNAGRPVGDYAFTTLHPKVAIIDYGEAEAPLSIADIPGLIEGAHRNRGLGFRFLRHIERCRCLVFVIDMGGDDDQHAIQSFETLRQELDRYDRRLLSLPGLVVANKMDLEGAAENLDAFRGRFPIADLIPVSCETGFGLSELRKRLKDLLATMEGSGGAEECPAGPRSEVC